MRIEDLKILLSKVSPKNLSRLKKILSVILILLIIIIPIRFIFFKPKEAQAAWYNSSWLYRVKLTIEADYVDADLTDFPVYVDLSLLPAGFHTNVNQTDARDIRVTKSDGETELPREVVFYTATSDTGELHFQYTGTLSSTVDTDVYIYYGNSGASDYAIDATYGAENVWDGDYVAVFHLQESGNGTTGEYLDSTTNDFDGTGGSSAYPAQTGAKIGNGQSFDGSNDIINVGDISSILNLVSTNPPSSSYDISGWFYKSDTSGGDLGGIKLTASNHARLLYRTSLQVYSQLKGGSTSVIQSSIATGSWHYISASYNTTGTSIGLTVDTTISTPATAADTDLTGTTMYVNLGNAQNYYKGLMDEVRISKIIRSATWNSTEYNNQNTPGTFFSTIGDEEVGIVNEPLYFGFDEGYGTTVHDSTGNGFTGTLTGATTPSWQTEDLCVSGKCLYFNGSTAYVNVATSEGTVQSVSFWVRPITTSEYLVDFDGGTHYIYASSGTITAQGFSSPTIYVDGNPSTTLRANAWQFIEVTTATSFTASNITIGKQSTNFLQGFVDEFKVYTTERTAAQVLTDYNARGAPDGVTTRFAPEQKYLSNGLVGYWKMDESSGNAADSSGNGLTLTNNGTTGFSTGKYGNGAGAFDGSSKYFSTATTVAGVQTISLWVYPASTTNNYFNLASGKYLTSSSGTLSATGFTSPTIYVNGSASTTIAANAWQLITVTDTTAISADTIRFGQANGSYYSSGSYLDETRIYNRRLTPAEVAKLYNWAPGPVGYWKMDENTGTDANDSSGNGNTGTLTNSPTWAIGKYGSAVAFAGNNQHIIRADDPDFDFADDADMTFSAWFKHTTASAQEIILSKYNEAGYKMIMESDGDITCAMDYDSTWTPTDSATSTAATYDDGTWHYASCVKTGASSLSLYIDGVLITTDSSITATNTLTNSDPLYIGINADGTSNDFVGSLDDVKIYNYARTPGQIVEDMNAGHPAPGSPVGSAYIKYKFDEGSGSTAYNSGNGGSSLDGTITSGTWTNSGKFGKALTFSASTTVTDTISDPGYTNSISLWVYPTTSVASKTLVTSGKLTTDSSSRPVYGGCTGTALSLNAWTHILAVSNGSGSCTLYQNGIQTASSTTGVTFGTSLAIGATSFTGNIDEFNFYTSILTADQVKLLYNQSSATVMGALSTTSDGITPSFSANDEYCPPGQGSACTPPVGHWKMDENTGSVLYDISGNANNGAFEGNLAWTSGKYGSGISSSIDAVMDRAVITNPEEANFSNTEDYTINTWVNITSSESHNFLVFRGATSVSTAGYYLGVKNSAGNGVALCYYSDDNVGTLRDGAEGTTNLMDSTWHLITCVMDRDGTETGTAGLHVFVDGMLENSDTSFDAGDGSTTINLRLGEYSASYETAGKLDEVRIYNYARTPAQIAWDYNRGAPVGWWKLDENTGTAANDSMGNSTAGTLTNSPTWATGKLNTAVAFAGSNQHIVVADDPDYDFADDESMTLTTWFKHSAASAQEVILSKYAAAGYKIIMESDSDITCGIDYDATWTPTDSATSTAATYDDGNWHHVACVKNGATSLALYIDGVLITTDSSISATNTLTNADPLYFGIDADGTSNDFTGTLDDIRIYRYPLTSQQIKTVMSEGAVRY